MNPKNEKLLEEYIRTRTLSAKSISNYELAVKSWDKNTPTPLSSAKREDVSTWFQAVRAKLREGTIDVHGQRLKIIYRWRHGRVKADEVFEPIPFKDLRRESKRKNIQRDKLVTKEEFAALLSAAKSPRVQALLTMLYESGCRKGEILSLKIRDIEMGPDYTLIHVKGKTGERAVPLVIAVPYLKGWLMVHPDRRPDQLVFVTAMEGRITPMAAVSPVTEMRDLCRRAGIRNIHPHMLRHTRLTELAAGGMGESLLKSFAGWTQGSVQTNVYLHMTGRSHVNAVLEAQGLVSPSKIEKPKPLLEVIRCPKCDTVTASGEAYCSRCGYVLDAAMRAEAEAKQTDKVSELQVELRELKADFAEVLKALRQSNTNKKQ